jgi:hypothetical protein
VSLNVSIDGGRDDSVSAACFVLVDHCRPGAVVAHASHEVAQPGGSGHPSSGADA